ncbi:MAG: SRPBCC family protein [Candidatus Hydrogenedentes bacterium]|nr:SRPBCC family protein [Candidatus Hydrogenedentota bacterium]
MTRSISAPRELVFEAWTHAEHLAHWWGPNGFTTTTYEMDVRPGGVWRFMMHGPDGRDYPNRIQYTEVVKPERLTYIHGGDADITFNVTVDFTEVAGKTELVFSMVFASPEVLAQVMKEYGALDGANQTLSRLEAHVATMKGQG